MGLAVEAVNSNIIAQVIAWMRFNQGSIFGDGTSRSRSFLAILNNAPLLYDPHEIFNAARNAKLGRLRWTNVQGLEGESVMYVCLT